MHIRPMLPEDVPSMIDIASDAFIEDELFIFLHPKRHEHPQSWRHTVRLKLLQRLLVPGIHTFVCVTDQRDADANPKGQVIGYCCWQRLGSATSKTAQAWKCNNRGLFTWLERQLLNLEEQYTALLRLDWSLSYPNREALAPPSHFVDIFDRFTDKWHLRSLAVDPRFQRRGVGQQLVAWGLDCARREDVPATLMGSYEGSRLYSKMGFRLISWDAFAVEQGWIGGQIMIWDRHQTEWTSGQYTRLAVGNERTVEIAGKTVEVEVVWNSPAPTAAQGQDPKETDVDGVSEKGP